MILRRVIEHVKRENWTAVGIDFVIVVVGVFVGIEVANWNEAARERQRTALLVEGLRQDLRVDVKFLATIDAGLAAFDEARSRSERPVPYFFRMTGSDTAPNSAWEAAVQAGLADLIHPSLLFDLGFYYSEREGLGVKYVRYVTFVEDEILPRLRAGPPAFYNDDGELKPEFAANMERLREWLSFVHSSANQAECLNDRLAEPTKPGKSCRPSYVAFEKPEDAP